MKGGGAGFGCILVILGGMLWSPFIAGAGEPQTREGFFLRLSGGPGRAETGSQQRILANPPDSPGPTNEGRFEFNGWSGDVNLAIGGMVNPHLALHGTLFGWRIPSPRVSYESADLVLDEDAEDAASVFALGAGLTYYFLPTNVYVSASIGSGSSNQPFTNRGTALDLSVGKEWWKGNNWGIGIAGAVGYHSLPLDYNRENWTGTTFALRFSASFTG